MNPSANAPLHACNAPKLCSTRIVFHQETQRHTGGAHLTALGMTVSDVTVSDVTVSDVTVSDVTVS